MNKYLSKKTTSRASQETGSVISDAHMARIGTYRLDWPGWIQTPDLVHVMAGPFVPSSTLFFPPF